MSIGGSLNMPYENDPLAGTPEQTEVKLDDVLYSPGVVTMASVVAHPPEVLKKLGFRDHHPLVVFRFVLPDGTFHRPIALMVRENELRDLKTLVGATVDGALNASRKARKRGGSDK